MFHEQTIKSSKYKECMVAQTQNNLIMNVLIEHYKKATNGRDTEYFNGKPVTQVTLVKLPLKFGYGSYNEPKKLLDTGIDVEDIIKITPEGELNMSDN